MAHVTGLGTAEHVQAAGSKRIHSQAPRAALRGLVRRFLVIDFPVALKDSHLPDTGFIAAFPFRGECRIGENTVAPRAAITGLCDRVRHHAHSRSSTVVIASFTPLGAAAFLRQPLDELANATVAMDDLIGQTAALVRLDEQLAEAFHHAHRVQLVENLLLARIDPTPPDSLVAAAVHWIERSSPTARIEELVRHIGLSQSALERRFRRVVGTSPKRFASLVRLRSTVRLQATGASLTEIAHAAGYFDQSHFIHDFKRVAGQPPQTYFAQSPAM